MRRLARGGGHAAIVAAAVLVTVLTQHTHRAEATGTTPYLQQIVMGRCYAHPTTGDAEDCPAVWSAVSSAFVGVDNDDVVSTNYSSYFDIAHFQTPVDGAMFWSGTGFLAPQYSDDGNRFWRMEDTPGGSLMNGLVFCGSNTSASGLNETDCPFGFWDDSIGGFRGAMAAYWSGASHAFAANVRGHVRALVYGTEERPAYRPDSFFGSIELPALVSENITHFDILLVRKPGEDLAETCTAGSVVDMKLALVAKGIALSQITCYEDPRDVRALLCVDSQTSQACQFASAIEIESVDEWNDCEDELSMALFLGATGWVGFVFMTVVVVFVARDLADMTLKHGGNMCCSSYFCAGCFGRRGPAGGDRGGVASAGRDGSGGGMRADSGRPHRPSGRTSSRSQSQAGRSSRGSSTVEMSPRTPTSLQM